MKHPETLAYSANSAGYTLFYRWLPIGGAGSRFVDMRRNPHVRRADAAMYQRMAEADIERIKAGGGAAHLAAAIADIDRELDTPTPTKEGTAP